MFSVQFTIGWPNHGRPVSSAALIDGSSRSETCDGSINRIEAQVGEARGSGYLRGLSRTLRIANGNRRKAGPRRFALRAGRVAASLEILTHSGCDFRQICGECCCADRCKVRS
jgi:hypothetical protein